MSDFVLLALIAVVVIILILTLVGFVFYTGLLSDLAVRTGSPPVKKIIIAYKLNKGPYKESGAAFTESCSISPRLSSIGLYYDDPNQVRLYSYTYFLFICAFCAWLRGKISFKQVDFNKNTF